jgi:hypothetical protein
MNAILVLLIGGVVGALSGASLFFVRGEPYKVETFLATTLRSILVSLLTGFSLSPASLWWQGLGFGVLYGVATILVVIFAEGGFKRSKDAPYLLIGGVATGAVIGLVDSFLAFPHR